MFYVYTRRYFDKVQSVGSAQITNTLEHNSVSGPFQTSSNAEHAAVALLPLCVQVKVLNQATLDSLAAMPETDKSGIVIAARDFKNYPWFEEPKSQSF